MVLKVVLGLILAGYLGYIMGGGWEIDYGQRAKMYRKERE